MSIFKELEEHGLFARTVSISRLEDLQKDIERQPGNYS